VNKSLFNKAERTVAVFASLKLKKNYLAKESDIQREILQKEEIFSSAWREN